MKSNTFYRAVEAQFNIMAQHNLYVVDIDKDAMWDAYMNAFPAGTNEIRNERREHDCNICKQFIRNISNVVSIIDGKVVSVWDVNTESHYVDVAEYMSTLVKSKMIIGKYMNDVAQIGQTTNNQMLANGTIITWNHLACTIPSKYVAQDYRSKLGEINSTKQVFERGLKELTLEASEIVLDLITSNSLYRGAEFKDIVTEFYNLQVKYSQLTTDLEKNVFVWSKLDSSASRIRNREIGTLLQDLSEGIELDSAVAKFEKVVAPTNYKRNTAVVTAGMVKQALATINELGLEPSLHRRLAKLSDVSVNNVLFANKTASLVMKDSLESILMSEVKAPKVQYDKVEEVHIDDFIKDVLPNITTMEVLLKNAHKSNLMSIIAPSDMSAKNILKWNNNFTWSYNGNITDSMKENVKKAGGLVDGDLRFSIQWNDNNDNADDLDAHCTEPNGNEIHFRNKEIKHPSSGMLDVDIVHPDKNQIAVENIIYTDKNKMPEGIYTFRVHNYTYRNGKNFSAEIEFDGKILQFQYRGAIPNDSYITVAKIKYSKANGFEIVESMPSQITPTQVWGITTEKFHKVQTMMLSPNYWDNQTIGNKHYFFLLEDCINPDSARGFYNEFLQNDLTPHRKVFEVLAGKMKCEVVNNPNEQLSGLGFSSTKRDELIVKVSGSFNRTLKIKF